MVACDLPQDVVRDILSRLALKSVLRFRCVHTTWNSLSKSASFVAAHLHHHNLKSKAHSHGDGDGDGNGGVLLAKYMLVGPNESTRLGLLNPQTYDLYRDVHTPFEEHPPWFEVAGSCNGLVCLFASCGQICLYNPGLQQHNMIPKSPISISTTPHLKNQNQDERCSFVFGFAYDSLINDYKVVSLVSQGGWTHSRNNNLYSYSYRHSRLAEVYTLGTNCWRQVGTPDHDIQRSNLKGNQAVVGGAIHWLAGRNNVSPTTATAGEDRILCFDVSSELMRLFWLPAAITETNSEEWGWRAGFEEMRIDVYGDGDWLCLVKFLERSYACDIWVMKEYGVEESWTKLHAYIPLNNICKPANFLGIGFNGELVFNHIKCAGLTLLYPDDDVDQKHYRYKDVHFNHISTMHKCIPRLVTNFVESLVSPLPRN